MSQLDLYLCDTGTLSLETLQRRYGAWLAPDERERLARFRAAAEARLFLAGRALLRDRLAQRLEREPGSLRFARNAAGKPRLLDPAGSGLEFNLSHSGNLLVLALSEAGPVGVDIDRYRRRNRLDALARRFCSAAEQALLAQLAPAERRRRFMEMWTLKEAFLKARGQGMEWPLSHFSGLPGEDALDIRHRDCALDGSRAWLYRHDPEHPLACMLLGRAPDPALWRAPLGAPAQRLPARPLRWAAG